MALAICNSLNTQFYRLSHALDLQLASLITSSHPRPSLLLLVTAQNWKEPDALQPGQVGTRKPTFVKKTFDTKTMHQKARDRIFYRMQ